MSAWKFALASAAAVALSGASALAVLTRDRTPEIKTLSARERCFWAVETEWGACADQWCRRTFRHDVEGKYACIGRCNDRELEQLERCPAP